MLLHDALKTMALALANDVHNVADCKMIHAQINRFVELRVVRQAELTHIALGFRTGFLEVPEQLLGHAMFLLAVKADLNAVIAVVRHRLRLQHGVSTGRDDRYGSDDTLVVIDAGHPELFA